jgi:hypothetical protein
MAIRIDLATVPPLRGRANTALKEEAGLPRSG